MEKSKKAGGKADGGTSQTNTAVRGESKVVRREDSPIRDAQASGADGADGKHKDLGPQNRSGHDELRARIVGVGGSAPAHAGASNGAGSAGGSTSSVEKNILEPTTSLMAGSKARKVGLAGEQLLAVVRRETEVRRSSLLRKLSSLRKGAYPKFFRANAKGMSDLADLTTRLITLERQQG